MNPDRTLPWDWFPGRVPENVTVHPEAYLETTYSFQLFRGTDGGAVRIGRGSSIYLGVMFDLGPHGRVSIGDYCLISWNTVFMDTRRLPEDIVERRRELELASARRPRRFETTAAGRPIRLERNVWVGFDACVLPGVMIGEGSVVGARSVVIEDVPPFSVVVGNPARVIRKLDAAAPQPHIVPTQPFNPPS